MILIYNRYIIIDHLLLKEFIIYYANYYSKKSLIKQQSVKPK